jgi:hypothetical protein
MSAIYLLTVAYFLTFLIFLSTLKFIFKKLLHFNHILFSSSPGLRVLSVEHSGLLLINLLYFFVVVSRIGRKSTTKCTKIIFWIQSYVEHLQMLTQTILSGILNRGVLELVLKCTVNTRKAYSVVEH